MAHPEMEWLTLEHRLRVQDPWLKILQQVRYWREVVPISEADGPGSANGGGGLILG